MTIVMRPTCWHQNFCPNGLSAPAQGLCFNVFSSITADFNISSAIRWAIQDQWSSGSLLVHIPVCSDFVFSVKDEHTSHLLNTVQTYQQMTKEGRILQIDFSTLVDYLHLLRACSLILSRAGRNSMLYLAAAVSDFYIPRDKMVMIPTHEVQTQNLLQTWSMSLSIYSGFPFCRDCQSSWLPVKLFASFCFLI